MSRNASAKEKVSYLRGLIDGQNTASEEQRRLYDAMLCALDAITDELNELGEAIEDIDDSIVDIYDAIDDLEDGDMDDMDFLETKCPHCGELVYFDHDMLEGDAFICPACNKEIELLDDGEDG